MRAVKILSKLKGAIREGGTKEIFRRLNRKIWAYRKVIVLVYDLSAKPPPKIMNPVISFHWANKQNVATLDSHDFDFRGGDLEKAVQRLEGGDKCLIGYVQKQPVTYLWLTTRCRMTNGVNLQLRQGQAFIYKTFTHENWRKKGFNKATLSSALTFCQHEEMNSVFIDVASSNTPSIRAIQGVGFEKVGCLTVWRIHNWNFRHLSAMLKSTFVSTNTKSRSSS